MGRYTRRSREKDIARLREQYTPLVLVAVAIWMGRIKEIPTFSRVWTTRPAREVIDLAHVLATQVVDYGVTLREERERTARNRRKYKQERRRMKDDGEDDVGGLV